MHRQQAAQDLSGDTAFPAAAPESVFEPELDLASEDMTDDTATISTTTITGVRPNVACERCQTRDLDCIQKQNPKRKTPDFAHQSCTCCQAFKVKCSFNTQRKKITRRLIVQGATAGTGSEQEAGGEGSGS